MSFASHARYSVKARAFAEVGGRRAVQGAAGQSQVKAKLVVLSPAEVTGFTRAVKRHVDRRIFAIIVADPVHGTPQQPATRHDSANEIDRDRLIFDDARQRNIGVIAGEMSAQVLAREGHSAFDIDQCFG